MNDSQTTTGFLHAPNEEALLDSPQRVVLDVPGRVVVKVLLIAAVFAVAVNIVLELRGLLIQMSIAIFLAIAADPVVRRLQARGLSRGRSVFAVMIGAFVVLALTVAVFVPPLVDQGGRFVDAAPGIVDDVRHSQLYDELDARYDVIDTASRYVAKLPGLVGDQLGTVFGAVVAGVFGTLTILFLTVFLLLGGGQALRGIVRLAPRLTERHLWTIIQGAYTGISAYVSGMIIIAVLGGASLTLVAALLGLPYALPLGLWMMLLEIIPMIGATIGAIPAVIVAFAAGGTVEGFVMLGFVVAYQQVENIYIQPRVQGRAAALSPLVVFVSVLVGAQLLGVLGALFAVPVAGVLQIFLRQIMVEQGSHELELPALLGTDEPAVEPGDGSGEEPSSPGSS